MPARDEPVVLNEDFGNVVVVDNIPVIGMAKFERLAAVLRKKFSAFGQIVENGVYIPVENESTLGYFFVEYETKEMALRAVAEGNHKKLDRKHTMRVNLFGDVDKYTQMDDHLEEPKKSDFESRANVTSWLLDENGRDQFVVRHGTDTEVHWNDPLRAAANLGRELAYGGEREKSQGKNWTELYTAWSPQGSYLATFHMQGIVLWGGEKFEKLGRFMHPGVKVVDFSPNEKYLVTSNGEDQVKKTDPECVIVWDIRSGKKLRGFPKAGATSWPIFKWSFDDTYLARINKDKSGTDVISVYEAPGMGMLDKKSFKVPNVQEVQWSPSQHIMSYWVPEYDNKPATVALVEVPSRKLIRERHAYAAADVKMHWQEKGDYLCVKFKRMKSKKTSFTQFEIFRMRQKEIPVEVMEMDDNIVAFAWDPYGPRFAVIHETEGKPRQNVTVCQLKQKKLKKLGTLENRACNCLFFAPAGNSLLIAGLGQLNGQLEFVDTHSLETHAQQEHFMCSQIEWDPSGRYVITSVCQPLMGGNNFRYTMENGYKVWSNQGELLATVPLEQCYQVVWRPRPKSLLSNEQLKEIKQNMRAKYWKRFEAEDDKIRLGNLDEEAKARQDMKVQWKAYRAQRRREHEEEAQSRVDLRHGVLSDDEDDYITETVFEEEAVSVTKTIMQNS